MYYTRTVKGFVKLHICCISFLSLALHNIPKTSSINQLIIFKQSTKTSSKKSKTCKFIEALFPKSSAHIEKLDVKEQKKWVNTSQKFTTCQTQMSCLPCTQLPTMQEMKCKQHGNTYHTVHQRKQIFIVVVMGLVGNWISTQARSRSRTLDGIKLWFTVQKNVSDESAEIEGEWER